MEINNFKGLAEEAATIKIMIYSISKILGLNEKEITEWEKRCRKEAKKIIGSGKHE